MNSILRVTQLAWSSHRLGSVGMLLVMMVWGFSPVFELTALLKLTNTLSARVEFFHVQEIVYLLFIFLLWSLLIPNICWQVYYYLFDIVRQYSQRRLAYDTLTKVSSLPLRTIENYRMQDLIARTSRIDTGDVLGIYLTTIFLLCGLIRAVSIFTVLYTLNFFVFATVILVAVPTFIVKNIMDRKSISLIKEQTEEERLSHSYLDILFNREAASELFTYGNRMALGRRWLKLRKKLDSESIKLLQKKSAYEITAAMIRTLGLFVVLVYALHLFISGQLAVGAIAAVIIALQHLQWLVSAFIYQINGVFATKVVLEDYKKLMELPVEVTDAPPEPAMDTSMIRITNLYYKYPVASGYTLRDIDVSFRVGEKIAIVGKNGSGKSTLIRLLLGLDVPDKGQIVLGPIGTSPMHFREHSTAMLQDFTRYSLSVKDNVALSDTIQYENEERIKRSLEWSGIANKMYQLNNGIETILNPTFNGVDLSGGQWQRLAAARAYFRERMFLVFDEPTAALDARNESELYKQFVRLSSDKTTIVVSHRLPIARLVDKIIVMHEGVIVEVGSHDQLMSLKGRYYRMFAAQASMYVDTKKE